MQAKEKFAENLINAIENNKIKLPTQPEVAVRLRECVDDPNLTSDKLAKVISHDPALAAKFIQIANSPLNRGEVTVSSLPSVISRLGLKYVANIAVGMAMEQIFQATNENIDKLMYEVWSSSTHVAAYANVLAKKYTKVPSDIASLAALMHQIGVLPILSYAQDRDEIAQDVDFLKLLIKEHHAKIGEAVLVSWKFPIEIAKIPKQLQFGVDNPNEKSDLIYVVQAALLKTKEDNKLFLDYDVPNDVLKQLNLEDALNTEQFKNELQHSMKFYCQL
ncbi:MAG: HDOD domain-containing protein [Proteobacteria bacterium]|nr:HDOD domain-containing protein [Pseudomonadota bacterium]